MVDNRLIEREAENQVNKKSIDRNSAEMISEFTIDHSDSDSKIVKYKNLDGEWNSLCSIEKLIDEDILDILEHCNLTYSAKIQNELSNLQEKLRNSWSKKYEMYRLSYRENNDSSSELYIPLNTEYTDDIIVQKIYTSNDKFVAEHIEEDIEYPLYELEFKDLYIKNITSDNQKVYKLENKDFSDYVDEYMNYNDTLEAKDGVIFSSIGTIVLYSILYYVWEVYSIMYFSIILAGSLTLGGLPIFLPLSALYSIFVYIIAYVKCSKFSDKNLIKTFEAIK